MTTTLDGRLPATWDDAFEVMSEEWEPPRGFRTFVAEALTLDDLANASIDELVAMTPPKHRIDLAAVLARLEDSHPRLFVPKKFWLRYVSETKTIEGHDYTSTELDVGREPVGPRQRPRQRAWQRASALNLPAAPFGEETAASRAGAGLSMAAATKKGMRVTSFAHFEQHLERVLRENKDAAVECLDLSFCSLRACDLKRLTNAVATHLQGRQLQAIVLRGNSVCLFGPRPPGNAVADSYAGGEDTESEDEDETYALYDEAHWLELNSLLALVQFVDVNCMRVFGNEAAYQMLDPRYASRLVWVANVEDAEEEPASHITCGTADYMQSVRAYYGAQPPFFKRTFQTVFRADLQGRIVRAKARANACWRANASLRSGQVENVAAAAARIVLTGLAVLFGAYMLLYNVSERVAVTKPALRQQMREEEEEGEEESCSS